MPEDTVQQPEMEMVPSLRTRRMLVTAIIVMAVVLVAGFTVVVTTLVKRASHPKASASLVGPGGRFGVSDINIAPGDRVRSLTMTDDRLAIHIAGEKGEEIVIVNVKTGVELGRFRLQSITGLAANGKF